MAFEIFFPRGARASARRGSDADVVLQARAEQTAGSALQRSAPLPVCVMVHTTDYIIHRRAKAERRARGCQPEHVCA